ncbi:MAG: hypothetical protein AAF602_31135 [Myxococcota bacterium]
MRTRGIWALLLAACGGSGLEGSWEGQCTIETIKGEGVYALSYAMTRDGEALGGTAVVEAPFLTEPIAGTLEGTFDRGADTSTLVATLGDEVLGFTLTHDLALDRQAETLSGPCSVQVPPEEPFDGTGTLERVGDLDEVQ